MKQWLENLQLSRAERNGIIVLMMSIVLLLGVRVYLVYWQPALLVGNMERYKRDITVFEADTLVELNTATMDQLEELPGIGPSLAEKIIEHRELLCGFTYAEQLLDVKGIGEAKLNGLLPFIKIDSLVIVY